MSLSRRAFLLGVGATTVGAGTVIAASVRRTDAPAAAPTRRRTFTPSFDATTTSPSYEMPTTTEMPGPGKPPFGHYTDDGMQTTVWGRIVTGTKYEKEHTFDPGEGRYYLPLPVMPHDDMTGPVGVGQVISVEGGESILHTCTVELDPGLDFAFGLVDSPDDHAGVAWLFLGGNHDPGSATQVVSATNPAAPGELYIIAFELTYLCA